MLFWSFKISHHVKHSQKMNMKNVRTWVIVQKNKEGICTCMAGHGEVCSHIGAILYAAEYAGRMKSDISCTDLKSVWPVPSVFSVPIVKITQMIWPNSKTNKPSRELVTVPSLDKQSAEQFLSKIQAAGIESAIMRIVEPFASKISKNNSVEKLNTLFNLYKVEYEDKSYIELLDVSI